ncbi:hypothetical protein P43SY_005266 [Pythium insidiosum]|uniref:Transmembrane protein n=1 Tax=Pythium insidiosum TaxID=114742 RepID=A0AAD5QA15_PYTIN|nr:hypothetical protein P43SY_005266 [Pythium insidiosum]
MRLEDGANYVRGAVKLISHFGFAFECRAGPKSCAQESVMGAESYAVKAASFTAKSGNRKGSNSGNAAPRSSQKQKYPVRHAIHILRRIAIFAAAISYIYVSISAGYRSILVMRGVVDNSMAFVPYVSTLIPHYLGKTTIRESPLVKDILGDSTAPRSDSLFLLSESEVSYVNCTGVDTFNPAIYTNELMRRTFAKLVAETSYNFTFLLDTELIMPVIDCTTGSIIFADDSATRTYYLLRSKSDPNDVYILTVSYSTQDYSLPEEHQVGAAASIAITLLGLNSESFWELESIPKDSTTEAPRVVLTACRTGFFVNAETEQCNVKNLNWDLSQDPIESMKVWPWSGYTTVRDSWAWVHCIHFFFAADTLFNLMVLLLVMFRNYRQGKIWVGDAFVSVSSTLILRGALVFVTWIVNGFWTLMEFCLQESNQMADVQRIFAYPEIIHADLLTFYLSLAGILGFITRERIDPALAVFLFEIGFSQRQPIAQWFPKITEVAGAFASYDYLLALIDVAPKYLTLTPMRLWTMHPLPHKDLEFIFATLFPCFASFILIIVYVPIRKLHTAYFPPPRITGSRVTGASTEGEALLSWKGSLTIFEVATGAPLQNRVGLVSDYDNCIYIKGMKYASADGVYCNGYVVASGKYLVSTDDLLAILLMVITRVRFKNVYVYEVNGHTVQQTARLVYPQTMSLRDLSHLNISVLS